MFEEKGWRAWVEEVLLEEARRVRLCHQQEGRGKFELSGGRGREPGPVPQTSHASGSTFH